MKHDRLHALTDGIFAIAMTLLVLELKIPEIHHATNDQLLQTLGANYKLFLSYLLSFTALFLYWRAHNFIVSVVAKNLDTNLVNINVIFLFFIGLVPFSTYFLGLYADTQVAIIVYALTLIAIGLTLLGMRMYTEKSQNIEALERSHHEKVNGILRLILPVVAAIVAIPLSFASATVALWLLVAAVC